MLWHTGLSGGPLKTKNELKNKLINGGLSNLYPVAMLLSTLYFRKQENYIMYRVTGTIFIVIGVLPPAIGLGKRFKNKIKSLKAKRIFKFKMPGPLLRLSNR